MDNSTIHAVGFVEPSRSETILGCATMCVSRVCGRRTSKNRVPSEHPFGGDDRVEWNLDRAQFGWASHARYARTGALVFSAQRLGADGGASFCFVYEGPQFIWLNSESVRAASTSILDCHPCFGRMDIVDT